MGGSLSAIYQFMQSLLILSLLQGFKLIRLCGVNGQIQVIKRPESGNQSGFFIRGVLNDQLASYSRLVHPLVRIRFVL